VAGQDEVRAHVVWAACTVVGILAFLAVLRGIPTVGWPLLLATIAAYLLDPVVGWLARRRLSRTVATGLLVALGIWFTLMLLAIGLPKALDQIYKLPAYTWAGTAALLDHLDQLFPTLLRDTSLPRDLAQLKVYLQEHLRDIVTEILPGAGSVVGTIVGGSLQAVSFVLGALVVPVVTFFLLRGWPSLIAEVDSLIPSRQRPFVRARMKDIDRVLGGFVRGQLTMAAVLSFLYSTALTVIGLKLAVVVGLVTGFGNLVPYVGTATGLLLSVGFCLVDFGVDHHLVFIVVTFAALVATDSIFITPRVVGGRVGLSPAAVIVAVLTFGALFSFAGVLLAVPSTAVLKVVGRTLMDTWRRSRTYQEG
jgi:predicted PurR-regulated permease PerM